MIRGVALLISQLFDGWPFRKLYLEATEEGASYFSSSFGRLFEEEGRLRQFEYSRDGYRDVVIASITRQRWSDLLTSTSTPMGAVASLLAARAVTRDHGAGDVLDLDGFCSLLADITGMSLDDLDRSLVDQGVDSLHVIEMIAAIEQMTETTVPIEDLSANLTSRDLYALYATQASRPRNDNSSARP